ncbi:malonyl-CoA decarboxylase domain-containing protein [Salipiger mangrovisoli]|uniref:Malonyl-CoA decarboxylase family protein n=1 Tax=Salipiger mangrovisoli TaxID=2865933 RepID=A0ABR9X807_9RHOB|nr:malonyl-CoA decarboxylase family protein [Salipiger mangrovisoli]MBE9639592.1 malonyl-CoA decarboxylase family protein [Salipiger mangrovisoli]
MGKQRVSFLSDFVEAITRRDRWKPVAGADATTLALSRPASERIEAACAVLMGHIGDASRVAVAEQALAAYAELDKDGKFAFFRLLRDSYGVEAEPIRKAYAAWDAAPDAAAVAKLFAATEPRRQALLRHLNLAPGATKTLVHMRADLLEAIRKDRSLAPVDADFAHLFASWFNRGFLTMRHIDWSTPASILERIMAYESVHPMAGWHDLRRRLAQEDRRLYAFFHPATEEEPLIFVEVALTRGVPETIGAILEAPVPTEPVEADTAVFYSINNSLPGLKGVSFGNFLIKQVAADLSRDLPQLKTFVTLSPAPGFAAWLAAQEDDRAQALDVALQDGSWRSDPAREAALKPEVAALAARYFVEARDARNRPVDPVARFHLGNGASAWRVNWPADLSPGALSRAHGLMINYLYELGAIEAQHEAYVREGTIAHGPSLAAALAE